MAKVQEFRALANFYAFSLSSVPLFWSQFWLLPNCILYFLFGYIPMDWTWENERNNSHHLKHAFGQMDSYVLPQSRGRDRGFWMVYATIMTFGMMSASHLGQNRWTWYLEPKSRVLNDYRTIMTFNMKVHSIWDMLSKILLFPSMKLHEKNLKLFFDVM